MKLPMEPLNWKDLLNRFYRDFSEKVESAKEAEAGMRPNAPTEDRYSLHALQTDR